MPVAITDKKKGNKKTLIRIAMFALALLVAFSALVGTTSADNNEESSLSNSEQTNSQIKYSRWTTEINRPLTSVTDIMKLAFAYTNESVHTSKGDRNGFDVFLYGDTKEDVVDEEKGISYVWGANLAYDFPDYAEQIHGDKYYAITGSRTITGIDSYEMDYDLVLRSNFQVKAKFLDIIQHFNDAARLWLTGGLAANYAGLVKNATAAVDSTTELLTNSIDGSSASTTTSGAQSRIYEWTKDVCNDVIVPLGLVVLAFIIANKIYDAVTERNNMAEIGTGFFIQLLIQILIAVLILTNVWALCDGLITISQGVILSARDIVPEGEGHLTASMYQWVFYYEIGSNSSIDIGEALTMYMQSWVLDIMMTIMQLIAWVIVQIRLIEIFFYMALSPIPIATLTDRSWGMMGRNFIKSFVAIAFQGLLIFMCLGMYQVMVEGILVNASVENIVSQVWGVAGYTLVLIFTMMKTGSISKAIFDAR